MTATDTEAGLLAAIADRPADDTPRLLLADYYHDADRPDDERRVRGEVHIRAARRAVLADPLADGPRLAFAGACEEWAGEVPCRSCKGEGMYKNPRGAGHLNCESCVASGRVPDGRADLAAFVRAQVELAALEATRDFGPACSWGGSCVCPSHERLRALRRRERELFEAYGRSWVRSPSPTSVPEERGAT